MSPIMSPSYAKRLRELHRLKKIEEEMKNNKIKELLKKEKILELKNDREITSIEFDDVIISWTYCASSIYNIYLSSFKIDVLEKKSWKRYNLDMYPNIKNIHTLLNNQWSFESNINVSLDWKWNLVLCLIYCYDTNSRQPAAFRFMRYDNNFNLVSTKAYQFWANIDNNKEKIIVAKWLKWSNLYDISHFKCMPPLNFEQPITKSINSIKYIEDNIYEISSYVSFENFWTKCYDDILFYDIEKEKFAPNIETLKKMD